MTSLFDPHCLTPAASLNRVRIVDLPGVSLPSHVRGATAYDLLSASVLVDQVRACADHLGLSGASATDPRTLLRQLDLSFRHQDQRIRATAGEVARRFGQHLGYLALTLWRGDAPNRLARPDWGDEYWAYWAGIEEIRVGGGLVAGLLGPPLVAHAMRTVAEGGMGHHSIRLAEWSALLPLIGAARTAPAGEQAILVLDFGHSAIKRACALYDHGILTSLRLLPALPAPSAQQPGSLAELLVSVIADTWGEARALGLTPAPTLVLSLGAYVSNGQPMQRQGDQYAALCTISDNLGRWLSRQVTDRVGAPAKVSLLHDGTAAAHTYAGHGRVAVITLGTALGVGFPPSLGDLRPVAPGLVIVTAGRKD